ncbi:hypothetical protein BC835DRAFT_451470 [Cytidiella melzeri]|nr:hypothetical protein BC835DRAFT_451470 [Cytidiella melzeri]
MKLSYAFTSPINPASASHKLTRAQVWAGLMHKSRDPLRFVPAIAECEVLEESAEGLTRMVTFKPGTGPPGRVKETVVFKREVRADFEMVGLGTTISNIISAGEGESDLYLTFTFNWNFPDIQEGTQEAVEKVQQLERMAKEAVMLTIKQIREMVRA